MVFVEGHSNPAPPENLLCQGTSLFPEATGSQRNGKIIIVKSCTLGFFLATEDDPGPGKTNVGGNWKKSNFGLEQLVFTATVPDVFK